jgi:hypothetical protein
MHFNVYSCGSYIIGTFLCHEIVYTTKHDDETILFVIKTMF